jgi:Heterokaryon incompatibility protein (HET)
MIPQLPFEYEPLAANRSIRLVTLVRDETAQIGFRCQVAVASLDDNPTFNALSYTWGYPYDTDPLDPHEPSSQPSSDGATAAPIFEVPVNSDRYLTVAENLFDALRQFSRDSLDNDPTYSISSPFHTPIWIDAISINQVDPAERSSQVSLMADIYSAAQSVIVWLGPDEPDPAFTWIHQHPSLLSYLYLQSKPETAFPNQGPCSPVTLRVLGVASMQQWHGAWSAYIRFFRRHRYFRRLWIVQETALAKSIVVRCGPALGPRWHHMVQLAMGLRESGWSSELEQLGIGSINLNLMSEVGAAHAQSPHRRRDTKASRLSDPCRR